MGLLGRLGLAHRIEDFASKKGYLVVPTLIDDEFLYDGYDFAALAERRFYNVGAGSFRHKYWTNLDYESDWYAGQQRVGFIAYDLTAKQALPIADDHAEIIFTANTMEHVPNDAVQNFVSEAYRVLKRGGVLRFVVPDAKLSYEACVRGDRKFWHRFLLMYRPEAAWRSTYAASPNEVSVEQIFVKDVAAQRSVLAFRQKNLLADEEIRRIISTMSMEDALDAITMPCTFDPQAPGNHMNWFDEAKAERMMREAGFKTVVRQRMGQSLAAPLRNPYQLDGHRWDLELYLEAVK